MLFRSAASAQLSAHEDELNILEDDFVLAGGDINDLWKDPVALSEALNEEGRVEGSLQGGDVQSLQRLKDFVDERMQQLGEEITAIYEDGTEPDIGVRTEKANELELQYMDLEHLSAIIEEEIGSARAGKRLTPVDRANAEKAALEAHAERMARREKIGGLRGIKIGRAHV